MGSKLPTRPTGTRQHQKARHLIRQKKNSILCMKLQQLHALMDVRQQWRWVLTTPSLMSLTLHPQAQMAAWLQIMPKSWEILASRWMLAPHYSIVHKCSGHSLFQQSAHKPLSTTDLRRTQALTHLSLSLLTSQVVAQKLSKVWKLPADAWNMGHLKRRQQLAPNPRWNARSWLQ